MRSSKVSKDAGPPSAREPQGIQPLPQREARADGTDYRRLTGEPDDLAQAVRRFDPGAVRAQQIRHSELTQLAGRPGHLRIRCREQVEAADHGVNRGGPQERPRVLRGVDDPRVPAPGDDDQAILRVDHDRGVLRYRILRRAIRALQQQPLRPVALLIGARHGPGEPDARHQPVGATVLTERPAARLILGAQWQQAVGFVAVGREAALKNRGSDVGAGQRGRVALRQLPSQRDQPAHMVGVIVRQHNVRHGGEIETELLRISEDRLGSSTRIDQETTTVDLEEGREPPLTDAVLGIPREHRGEDGDADGARECWVTRRWRRARRNRGEEEETEGDWEGPPHVSTPVSPFILRAGSGLRQYPRRELSPAAPPTVARETAAPAPAVCGGGPARRTPGPRSFAPGAGPDPPVPSA